jgi:hypothetical protein
MTVRDLLEKLKDVPLDYEVRRQFVFESTEVKEVRVGDRSKTIVIH